MRRPIFRARPARLAALRALLVACLVQFTPGLAAHGQGPLPGQVVEEGAEREADPARVTVGGELTPQPRRPVLVTPYPDCPPAPQR